MPPSIVPRRIRRPKETLSRLHLLATLARMARPFYGLTFIAAASRTGLLKRLALDEAPMETLADEYGIDDGAREAFRAWLDTGVALGILGRSVQGYTLRNRLAMRLASLSFDAFAALAEEMVTRHYLLLLDTPDRLRTGKLWPSSDHDTERAHRTSDVLAPAIETWLRARLPSTGRTRLLDAGTGRGTYLRTVLEHNPHLEAVGVERDPISAANARDNLSRWELADRASVLAEDIRTIEPTGDFDVVTMINTVSCFIPRERGALFAHLRRFLNPTGYLVVMTHCLCDTPEAAILNLKATSTQGEARLPTVPELRRTLEQSGFGTVQVVALVRRASLYAFDATRTH